MKKYFLFIIILSLTTESFAQTTTTGIDQFYFMKGVWKGKGWVLTGNTKAYFNETETVNIKLSGTAIQIEAYGFEVTDSSKIINDALGILKYNDSKKQYELNIYQADGSFAVADVQRLRNNELEWSLMISPSLRIKYIIKVTGNKWYEAGYRSTDGISWKQTFEMVLVKQ